MATSQKVGNPLEQLPTYGQSYWLDNLTRHMIAGGELQGWIRDRGLRGITANPTTFREALTSRDYDRHIESLTQEGRSTKEIYEALLIHDVQQACDLFSDVYRETDGLDGYVSLEVSPHLAHDTEATMAEARRYVERVNRPNLYIKVPATDAGIPAIEQLLFEGVAVNITLLFSIPSYQAVIEAYISALERRVTSRQPLETVVSVASFFVSRIDVLVDQLLQRRIPLGNGGRQSSAAQLQGRAAIANAKLAYRTFRQAFGSDRWARLAVKGARVQRPLWASTGTKNPAYRDVMYVESLVGRDTVNTMPETTLRAFADHGRVVSDAVEAELEQAELVMVQLEKTGINFNCVTWQLEHEGVQKFVDAYDAAMAALDKKRSHLRLGHTA
ncbi:MAG: transaldolase [Nitrospira sp.]|jgi:transaldolase|nr:transaldolase [Nitrospira sp.]MDI3463730.1 Transaldolase [Nitrospira sp.]